MASTSVRVAVRVRPMAAKELLANSTECISYIPGTTQLVVGGTGTTSAAAFGGPAGAPPESTNWMAPKSFTFDHVFDPLTTQDTVYADCVAPLVDRFLEGFNATTGSGKTYSMGIGLEGVSASASPHSQGIVPRAVTSIFDRLRQMQRENPSSKAQVFVSFLELYNEELVDLLNPRPRTALPPNMQPSIREDGTGKIVWLNVKEEEVKSPEELLSALQRGTLCRTTGSTDMNATSSRSHAIFTVTLRQEKSVSLPGTQSLADADPSEHAVDADMRTSTNSAASHGGASAVQTLVSKFHFVDLAGSERLKRTNAEGDRKKEGISINQGLLALGNVISALGDETRRSSHVPYRDSRLTRMLQDSLGGNSQTLMLACVSPSDLNYAETVNTLNYANRARNIKNRVIINQEWQTAGGAGGMAGGGDKDREIKSLRQTVSQLRTELAMIRATGSSAVGGGGGGGGGGDTNMNGVEGAAMRSGGMDQREIQYYQRRERDVMAELEMYKNAQRTVRFGMDSVQFRCNRLVARVRELSQQLAQVSMERDAAVLEKSRLLRPGLKLRVRGDDAILGSAPAPAAEADSVAQIRSDAQDSSGPQNMVVVGDGDDMIEEITAGDGCSTRRAGPARPGGLDGTGDAADGAGQGALIDVAQRMSTDPGLADVHQVVQGYISALSTLRLQLAETEDKLAWQTEAMTKLSRRGARFAEPVLAWTEAEDKELGISSAPVVKPIMAMRAKHASADIEHEKSLLKGLRDNPLIKRMLDADLHGADPAASAAGSMGELGSGVSLAGKGREAHILDSSLDFGGLGSGELLGDPDFGSPGGDADGGDGGLDEPPSTDPDMYVLINKIQNDIAEHEALVERIHRRDAEYEVMKKAYEQKLNVLQSQLQQFQRERDQALKRFQEASGLSKKDRAGSIAAAKSKYDEEKRRLDSQIAEYKRKLGDNSRMQTTNRSRSDQLTKELQSTIEALKNEKARMLQELRKEAQRNRDMTTANQREIARLRRKERAAAETAKRLERSNQLQRAMLKKRNEEVSKSQSKLKSILQLLKRSSTPNRVFKSLTGLASGGGSGSQSPVGKRSSGASRPTSGRGGNGGGGNGGGRGMRRVLSGAAVSEFLAGISSPIKMSTESIAMSMPSIEVRSQFKKQMVDKEIAACVLSRRTQAMLEKHKQARQRLVGEQRELIAERTRVVEADYKRTGEYRPDEPQYMDERLQVIDVEISDLDKKIGSLEELGRRHTTMLDFQSTPASPPRESMAEDVDLSWENALNLVRSLDRLELEAVAGLLLEDIIAMRVNAEELQEKLEDRDNVVSQLKRMVDVLRVAALAHSQELERQRQEAAQAIEAAVASAMARLGSAAPSASVQSMSTPTTLGTMVSSAESLHEADAGFGATAAGGASGFTGGGATFEQQMLAGSVPFTRFSTGGEVVEDIADESHDMDMDPSFEGHLAARVVRSADAAAGAASGAAAGAASGAAAGAASGAAAGAGQGRAAFGRSSQSFGDASMHVDEPEEGRRLRSGRVLRDAPSSDSLRTRTRARSRADLGGSAAGQSLHPIHGRAKSPSPGPGLQRHGSLVHQGFGAQGSSGSQQALLPRRSWSPSRTASVTAQMAQDRRQSHSPTRSHTISVPDHAMAGMSSSHGGAAEAGAADVRRKSVRELSPMRGRGSVSSLSDAFHAGEAGRPPHARPQRSNSTSASSGAGAGGGGGGRRVAAQDQGAGTGAGAGAGPGPQHAQGHAGPAPLRQRLSSSPVRAGAVWRAPDVAGDFGHELLPPSGPEKLAAVRRRYGYEAAGGGGSGGGGGAGAAGPAGGGGGLPAALAAGGGAAGGGGSAMGGLDVFERLASAHTQASQAKVITRVTVDKDALLGDVAAGGAAAAGPGAGTQ